MVMHKYGAKKTEVDGIIFDSKAESQFYTYLKIAGYQPTIQPVFELLPKFKEKRYGTLSAIEYIADFQIGDIVFDVKGIETPAFSIKRKMFCQKYQDLTLIIVKGSGLKWKLYRGKVTKGTETNIDELFKRK